MSRKNLKNHVRTMHENKNPTKCVCDKCGKGFRGPSQLMKHAATHGDEKVQCDICGKWQKHEYSLQEHKARAHRRAPQKCPHCDTLAYNPNEMKIHMSQFHSQHKHQCSICQKSFARPVRLKVCVRWFSRCALISSPSEANIRCSNLYSFSQDHISSVHADERTYKCLYCTKFFKAHTTRFRHMTTQHPREYNLDREKRNSEWMHK